MSKFKVGDSFIVGSKSGCHNVKVGERVTVTDIDGDWYTVQGNDSCGDTLDHFDPQEVTKGDKPMGRRTFRLLKETPDVKKGSLWQEACDDGDQEYVLITPEHNKGTGTPIFTDRSLVEEQPKWFEEVFPATETYLTKSELDAFKAFIKGTKKKAKK